MKAEQYFHYAIFKRSIFTLYIETYHMQSRMLWKIRELCIVRVESGVE